MLMATVVFVSAPVQATATRPIAASCSVDRLARVTGGAAGSVLMGDDSSEGEPKGLSPEDDARLKAVLRRMIATPPQPHEEMRGKAGARRRLKRAVEDEPANAPDDNAVNVSATDT